MSRIHPARALVASFALMIALGVVLLHQAWAAQPDRQLTWSEAVFTATSAVCVTGLTVRPPGDFTVAGQVVIAVLIQVGGLGIMTFGLFFFLLLGRRLSLFGRSLVMSSLSHSPWEDFWPLLRTIVVATLVVEGGGAALLTLAWWGEKGVAAIPWGLFHAVSAFCNAGFGLHAASLAPWKGNPLVVVTVGLLILVGGTGFLPIAELLRRRRARFGVRRRLSLHTRVVVVTTLTLLAIGWIGFAVLEWGNTLAPLTVGEKLLAIWFQGITPRTAGFSTLGFGAMAPATLLLVMGLMFVGASPGSTGGGVKTTTVAVLGALLISTVRSRRQTSLFRRGIAGGTIATAVVVLILALATLTVGLIAVVAIEHGAAGGSGARVRVLAEAFEAVSAFGTVGLSTGVTAELSPRAWYVLVGLMFVGRVGPLTLGMALAGRRPRPEPGLPEEDMMVG